jgi:hypothetical protein
MVDKAEALRVDKGARMRGGVLAVKLVYDGPPPSEVAKRKNFSEIL